MIESMISVFDISDTDREVRRMGTLEGAVVVCIVQIVNVDDFGGVLFLAKNR